jgi:hypothetical protein
VRTLIAEYAHSILLPATQVGTLLKSDLFNQLQLQYACYLWADKEKGHHNRKHRLDNFVVEDLREEVTQEELQQQTDMYRRVQGCTGGFMTAPPQTPRLAPRRSLAA